MQTYCRFIVWRSQYGVVSCRLIADLLFGVLDMGLYHADLWQTYFLAFSIWGCIMQTYCRFIVWRSQHGDVSWRLIADLLFGVLNMGLYDRDLL